MTVQAAIVALLTSLLLTGQSVDLSKVYFQPAKNYAEDILTLGKLHQETTTHLNTLHDALLDDSGVIAVTDTIYQMVINAENRELYKQECEKWSNQMLEALELSNNALIATVNLNTFLNELQKSSGYRTKVITGSPKFLSILVGGALGGIAAYSFLKKVMEGVDKSQNIVNDVAANNEEDRNKVVKIFQKNGVGIADNSSPQEISVKFKTLGMGTRQHIVNDARGYNTDQIIVNGTTDNSHLEIAAADRQAFAEAAVDLGSAAVDGTVNSYLTVTGGVSYSNVIKNKYLGAGVDLLAGLSQTDPLGLLGRSLRVTASSRVQDSIPMASSVVSSDEALLAFANLKVKGIDEMTLAELANGLKSHGSTLARLDGDGDDLKLSYPRYVFSQNIPLEQDPGDSDTWLGKVKIPADLYDYLFDFTITNMEGLLKLLKNIRPGDLGDIQLQELNGTVCLLSEKEVNGSCVAMSCAADQYNCSDGCAGEYLFWDSRGNTHCIFDLAANFSYSTYCPSSPTVFGETLELFTTPDGWDVSCTYLPQDDPNTPGELKWEYVSNTLVEKSVVYWRDLSPIAIDYTLKEALEDSVDYRLSFTFCANGRLKSASSQLGSQDHGTTVTFNQPFIGSCSDTDVLSDITNYSYGIKDGKEITFDGSGDMLSCTIWVDGVDTGSCLP
jgi:hypothetical protein